MSIIQKRELYPIKTEDIKNRWNKIAKWYSDLINEGEFPPRKNIIDPLVKDLIIQIKPKIVFDAGCGEGYLSRFMAERGIKVIGCDISEEMIKIAGQKEDAKPMGIKYYVSDLQDINKEIFSYNFDLILCHQVLMNVVDLQRVFDNFYRLLLPEGKLIITITHPFLIEKESEWFKEEVVDNNYTYFDIFWKLTTFYDSKREPSPVKIYTCHRPLQEYITCLRKAGFSLSDIIEPRDHIPLYMIIMGVK
jgi:2-polyprenyl-3-methyl-5-hydroxy-6-metoxy-1,4-benzoquinol methylase